MYDVLLLKRTYLQNLRLHLCLDTVYFDTEGVFYAPFADNLVVEYEIMLSACIEACFLISLEL